MDVHPHGDDESWIVVELHVDATSEDAWEAFIPHWILMGRFSQTSSALAVVKSGA